MYLFIFSILNYLVRNLQPITDGNNIENPPEKKLLAFMWCCSITSLIINCPIGVFSVCYSYMVCI